MLLQRLMLCSAALLTPCAVRGEWLEEWTAELEHIRRTCPRAAFAFCRGAFADAWWLRRHSPVREGFLESPLRCLGLLAASAAICVYGALPQLAGAHAAGTLRAAPLYALFFAIALLILPSSTSLSLGDYSAGGTRVRRWAFLAAAVVGVAAPFLHGEWKPLVALSLL
ncbi:MAG: hypothetical protein JNL62_02640, partial [Bryobacterales bacterium]|nr:hypothetical protein [Bryobacterales bacterium]